MGAALGGIPRCSKERVDERAAATGRRAQASEARAAAYCAGMGRYLRAPVLALSQPPMRRMHDDHVDKQDGADRHESDVLRRGELELPGRVLPLWVLLRRARRARGRPAPPHADQYAKRGAPFVRLGQISLAERRRLLEAPVLHISPVQGVRVG